MKKLMKTAMGIIAAIFIIIVVFWGSIVYVSDYKITTVDTSVSPDGTYELVLKAVGEADWPFGAASGRLILYENKSRISKADFELWDDGGCIRSSIWEVTWHEDYVEIILSGDEQFDEQIILYFDGRKEIKQGRVGAKFCRQNWHFPSDRRKRKMYELVQVSEKCYYINCPAKNGVYVPDKDNVYLVDSGNDKDAGRKVRQILDKNGWHIQGDGRKKELEKYAILSM